MLYDELKSILSDKLKDGNNLTVFFGFLNNHFSTLVKNNDELADSLILLGAHFLRGLKITAFDSTAKQAIYTLDLILNHLKKNIAIHNNEFKTETLKVLLISKYNTTQTTVSLIQEILLLINKHSDSTDGVQTEDVKNNDNHSLYTQTLQFNFAELQQPLDFNNVIHQYTISLVTKLEMSREICKWIARNLVKFRSYYDCIDKSGNHQKTLSAISNNIKEFNQFSKNLDNELSFLVEIISVPFFEANCEEIVKTLEVCGFGSLMIAISCILSNTQYQNSSTDESDYHLSNIIFNKSVKIINQTNKLLQQSSSSFIQQNFCAFACDIILHSILQISPPLKEFLHEYLNLNIFSEEIMGQSKLLLKNYDQKQNELLNLFFSFSKILIEQYKRENFIIMNNTESQNAISSIDIMIFHTATQRFSHIFEHSSTVDVLEILAVLLYKVISSFGKLDEEIENSKVNDYQLHPVQDDIISSDSVSDDESSSILGALFKEPTSLGKDHWKTLKSDNSNFDSPYSDVMNTNLLAENVIQIYDILNDLASNCKCVSQVKTLNVRVDLLVYAFKDLQKGLDVAVIEKGVDFKRISKIKSISVALFKYMQTLIKTDCFTADCQQYLLEKLNVSPWKENCIWPLQITPQILALLIQILQMKPVQERESASLCVWHKLVNTVIDIICTESFEENAMIEDINVEHLHILCYIFYSLNLMQKKSILLLTTSAIIRGAASIQKSPNNVNKMQILLFSRLVMLLDFIMHYLYTIPKNLQNYIDWKIFKQIDEPMNFSHTESFFYEICTYSESKNEKKLDGLAWNFLLCTPEKLKFNLLIQTLNEVLDLPLCCVRNDVNSPIRYAMLVSWNLLICLPPAIQQVEFQNQSSLALSNLLWKLRTINPTTQIHYFVVNSLIKQGVPAHSVEQLIESSFNGISNKNFLIDIPIMLDNLIQHFSTGDVTIGDFLRLDFLVLHIYGYINFAEDWKTDAVIENIFSKTLHLLISLKELYMTDVLLDTPENMSPTLYRILLEIGEPSKVSAFDLSSITSVVGVDFNIERFHNIQSSCALDTLSTEINFEAMILNSASFHLSESFKDSAFTASSTSLLFCFKSLTKLIHALSTVEIEQVSIDKYVTQLLPLTTDVTCSYVNDLIVSSCSSLYKKPFEDYPLNALLCDSILTKTVQLYYHVLHECFDQSKTNVSSQCAILMVLLNFWEKLIQSNICNDVIQKLDAKIGENIVFSFINSYLPQTYCLKIIKVYNKIKESMKLTSTKRINDSKIIIFEQFMAKCNLLFNSWLKHALYGPNIVVISAKERNVPDNRPICGYIKSEMNASEDLDKGVCIVKLFFENQFNEEEQEEVIPCKIDILTTLFEIGSKFFLSHRNRTPINSFMEMLLQMIKDNNVGCKMLYHKLFKWILIAKSSIIFDLTHKGKLSTIFVENISTILVQTMAIISSMPGSNVPSQNIYDECVVMLNDLCEVENIIDEEETTQEESDDDMHSYSLCTFVSTQRDFVNQHWYYCYTCKMTDGIGVCSVCAQICHKNHDISYAKYGNFFCDCGAKEDGSCLALNKYNGNNTSKNSNKFSKKPHRQEKYSYNTEKSSHDLKESSTTIDNIEGVTWIHKKYFEASSILKFMLEVTEDIKAIILKSFMDTSSLNCYKQVKMALRALQNEEKIVSSTDRLLILIGNTKEGAFENIKSNFSGEHGVLIRQLLSSNSIRRVAYCNLLSGYNNRQYLTIAHDKGKITFYQLTTFLKQVTTEKQTSKWALVKSNTLNVPCTVISISTCDVFEDVLAICGIRECHIMQISSMITAKQHKTIVPLLEGSNYIKKCVWLPGTICLLAIVTTENIQIFDLTSSLSQPKYIFILPTGKVRECTFAHYDQLDQCPLVMFVISSTGHIYFQHLDDDCLAVNGSFYVTNIIESDIFSTDSNGNVFGGGYSIYYSHAMDLLFVSFASGRNFTVTFDILSLTVRLVVDLNISNIATKTYAKSNQPLHMWTETTQKPGLIMAMHQHSNTIIAYMVFPTLIFTQEIRPGNHKTKILDFIILQQSIYDVDCSNVVLMILSDDGTIHIYHVDNTESTYWLSSQYQSKCKAYGKNNKIETQKESESTTVKKDSGTAQTPIDFFEHCNQITDLEFGGDDLLQIYNVQQLKHRLSTNGLYVACSNPSGFNLTISNLDTNTIITGVRFLFGMQDINRIPKSITVSGRTLPINVSQCRWVDVPLTIDEIFQEEKLLTITFGASQDAENVVMIDSVKVYGVPRDQFNSMNRTSDVKPRNLKTKYPVSFTLEFDKYHLNPNGFTMILHRYLKLACLLFQQNTDRVVEKFYMSKAIVSLTNVPLPSTVQEHISKILLCMPEKENDSIECIKLNFINDELNFIIEMQNWYEVDPEKFYSFIVMLHQISISHAAKHLHLKYHKMYKKTINKILIITKHLYQITAKPNHPFKIVRPGLLHTEFVLQVVVQLWILVNATHQDSTSKNEVNGFLYDCLIGFDSKFRYFTKQALSRSIRMKRSSNNIGSNIKHKVLKFLHSQMNYDFLESMPLDNIIPMLQVFYILTVVLDTIKDEDKTILQELVFKLINFLKLNFSLVFQQDCINETTTQKSLILLKFFLMILSSAKADFNSLTESDIDCNVKYETTKTLLDIDFLQTCLFAAKSILNLSDRVFERIKPNQTDYIEFTEDNDLFMYHPFVSNKSTSSEGEHTTAILSSNPTNVLEALLRITYYAIKLSDNLNSSKIEKQRLDELKHALCDVMVKRNLSAVRKTIRKTLLILCGSKDSYKLLKDQHFFSSHLKHVSTITDKLESIEKLNEIADGLKSALEIAVLRPGSWQKYCVANHFTLTVLFKITCFTDEEVIHMSAMRLIQSALCNNDKTTVSDKEEDELHNFTFKEYFAKKLLETFVQKENEIFAEALKEFIMRFLIYPCPIVLKNQSHQIINQLIGHSTTMNMMILNLFKNLMNEYPNSTLVSLNFMDLFSGVILQENTYLQAETSKKASFELADNVVNKLLDSIDAIVQHPNIQVYSYLQHIIESDSYYFEQEGCLNCNYTELPFTNVKLSTAKADARFTTSTLYIKLVQTYCISHVILRITDIKKTKMLKKLKIFYCNKNIQGIVELKTNVHIWKLAKIVNIEAGQTDIRIEFSTPVVACNLMIEYSEFYNTVVGCTDTIQCPRCSAMVSSNPGMCGNCGENVFQCHKCRAINYDERDPFICNSCGFSKYAKFDYTLIAKPSYYIDDIENDDERAKVMQNVHTLMEKFDRISRQLQNNKRFIETLLYHTGAKLDKVFTDVLNPNFTYLHKSLQIITQKYCFDSKNLFEEMYIIQTKIFIHKRAIMAYDNNMMETKTQRLDFNYSNENCFKCLMKKIEELMKLLKSLRMCNDNVSDLFTATLIEKLLLALNIGNPKSQSSIIENITFLINKTPKMVETICKEIKKKMETFICALSPDINIELCLKSYFALLESLTVNVSSVQSYKTILIMLLEVLFLALRCKHPRYIVVSMVLKIILNVLNVLTHQINTNKSSVDLDMRLLAFGSVSKSTCDENFLMEKYFTKWYSKTKNLKTKINSTSWIEKVIFNVNSFESRQMATNLLSYIFKLLDTKVEILENITSIVFKISDYPHSSQEFLFFFKTVVCQAPWIQYLVLNGFLEKLLAAISTELTNILKSESCVCKFSASDGLALERYIEIFSLFWEDVRIQENCKMKILHTVLRSYLDIKTITFQRNLRIEHAEAKLLKILEDLTAKKGTDSAHFIQACIQILKDSENNDLKTPFFIFEHLYSIVHPEESDVKEFFIILEKDPQQEDFLQGRMVGNPYPSNDTGIGPLMKDVKNKICRECELLALLEDENGMELLVCNKIINLNLPVKDVYKNIWVKENGSKEAMKIMYRMRGLLGDATEEFVETFESASNTAENYEKLYFLANFIADNDGLSVILRYLNNPMSNLSLFTTILKLLIICVKVKKCLNIFCMLETKAFEVLLKNLKLCINNSTTLHLQTCHLLEIIDDILVYALNNINSEEFMKLSDATFGSPDYLECFLQYATTSNIAKDSKHFKCLTKIIGGISYGNTKKMEILYNYFKETLAFEQFDTKHDELQERKIILFSEILVNIAPNNVGNLLREYIYNLGLVDQAINYFGHGMPSEFIEILKINVEYLKKFASRASLKYILKILAGLAENHENTQLKIANTIIPLLHMLEQVSTDENVGILAENLLEILRSNQKTATIVETTRNLTKAEKKRLAMATREKQLNLLGMKANEKGQVILSVNPIQEMESLKEESGLFCIICREGYNCQPSKVLGIYTFCKRTILEEFDLNSTRKAVGHATVTVFNIIHIDCHVAAVRLARGRDEWESASLQNTNTKCNGILPLWGPSVPEASFVACANRHQGYIREATQCNEVDFSSCIHDLKQLISRFSFGKSFHEDSGGGGPQSNMNFVPYVIFYAVYMALSSNSISIEDKKLNEFINDKSSHHWINSAYQVDGPLYHMISSLPLKTFNHWNENRLYYLKRLIVMANVRHFTSNVSIDALDDAHKVLLEFKIYKPYLLAWSLTEMLYSYFDNVKTEQESEWSLQIFNYIRNNDSLLLKNSEKILSNFNENFLPCTTIEEFWDIAGLYECTQEPTEFFENVFVEMGT